MSKPLSNHQPLMISERWADYKNLPKNIIITGFALWPGPEAFLSFRLGAWIHFAGVFPHSDRKSSPLCLLYDPYGMSEVDDAASLRRILCSMMRESLHCEMPDAHLDIGKTHMGESFLKTSPKKVHKHRQRTQLIILKLQQS